MKTYKAARKGFSDDELERDFSKLMAVAEENKALRTIVASMMPRTVDVRKNVLDHSIAVSCTTTMGEMGVLELAAMEVSIS